MTPAEKTKLLAERVMEWGFNEAKGESDGCRFSFRLASDNYPIWSALWSPLTNLEHAVEVLDAMRAKGWHAVMLCPASGRHYCDFYQGPMTNRDSAPDGHESLAAAICHAALLATGVKEEEL